MNSIKEQKEISNRYKYQIVHINKTNTSFMANSKVYPSEISSNQLIELFFSSPSPLYSSIKHISSYSIETECKKSNFNRIKINNNELISKKLTTPYEKQESNISIEIENEKDLHPFINNHIKDEKTLTLITQLTLPQIDLETLENSIQLIRQCTNLTVLTCQGIYGVSLTVENLSKLTHFVCGSLQARIHSIPTNNPNLCFNATYASDPAELVLKNLINLTYISLKYVDPYSKFSRQNLSKLS